MTWKARIEWVYENPTFPGISSIFGTQTLTGTGSTVVSSDPAPTFGGKGRGTARVTVLSGALLLALDDGTPTETDSVRLTVGQGPTRVSVAASQVISIIEAADADVGVAVPDGSDAALGAKGDASWSGSGSGSLIAVAKAIWAALTGTVNVQSAAPAASTAATIDQTTNTITASIDLATQRLHRIIMPGTWTAAPLTFQSSVDGSTWNDLYTEFGEYTIGSGVAGASRSIVVDYPAFFGVRYLKIRSGTAASPVNQAASRSLTLVTVPR